MTTVIFYKGMMGSDTLQTKFDVAVDDKIKNEITFSLVKKTYIVNNHLLGLSGDVNTILKFIEWFENGKNKKFKPKGKFSIIDWDGENLVSWWTKDTFSTIGILLDIFTCGKLGSPFKKVLKHKNQNYDEKESCVFTIGSGEDFVSTAFSKLAFQFERLNEKISDHLATEEVIKYLIIIASKHDPFTNDKINIESFTSVSPQNASLSKG